MRIFSFLQGLLALTLTFSGTTMAENATELVDTSVLAREWEVAAESSEELRFELGNFAGKQVRLRLDGRIDWKDWMGNTFAMTILINGQPLEGRRLMNKPLAFTMREGSTLYWTERNGNSYRLVYGPDFSDRLKSDTSLMYGFPEEDQNPFHFMWDITPYVLAGKNTIQVSSPEGMDLALKFRDVAVELGDPIPYQDPSAGIVEEVAPAPTGAVPTYVPKAPAVFAPEITVFPSGNIAFNVRQSAFLLESRSSLPDGKWTGSPTQTGKVLKQGDTHTVKWSGPGYDVERTVTLHKDHVSVSDTVQNLTGDLLGVMLENRLKLPAKAEHLLLAGREIAWVTETRNAFHPTVMAILPDVTVGLVAENDLFRTHNTLFRSEKAIGLADYSLGIPGKEHRTLEWSIYISPEGDYWDVVNAIRRNWKANFRMIGPVTFTGSPGEWGAYWPNDLTDARLKEWLKARNHAIAMVMTHVATDPSIAPGDATVEKNFWHHGTAIPGSSHWKENTRAAVRKLKEVAPEVKVFAYIHPNLTTEVGHEQKYRDSVALERDGSQAQSVYKPGFGLYIPTLNNSYGKALEKVYQQHIDDLDANLYVDEITVAVPTEGPYPEWDGSTVAIDRQTHAVTGKLSNATLLMQPWLDRMMAYARSKGKTAFVNTAPPTRSMLNWKIQHITEDTGPAGIYSTHLSTPLAWTYDIGELPGYQHIRESLSHGAISFARSGGWSDHLFPITPIELRAGVMIAEERILTNHSGRFGWGDRSKADVLVFDGEGNHVENPDAREVEENGEVLTELRMPGDHFAVLIRKSPDAATPDE